MTQAEPNGSGAAPESAGDAGVRRVRHVCRRVWRRVRANRRLWVAVVLCLMAAGGTSSVWWQTCGFTGCPSLEALREWRPAAGDRLLADNGDLLGLLDPVRRVPVLFADIPEHVRDAFVAVEDRRFFEHRGLDFRGIARAAVQNVRAGGVREGASTITMQLARNAFLTDNTRGWRRKLLEVRYTWLIEEALTKDEILERYLNTIYFGSGTWGVEAASRDLFGKSVRRVSLVEAALLAGLPKAPSSYAPRRYPDRAKARRDVVLGVMARAGMLDSARVSEERSRALKLAKRPWRPEWPAHSWAVDVVRATLDSLEDAGAISAQDRGRNLAVHTTINARAQRAAERAVLAGAKRVDRARDAVARNPTQGALVAMDPATGAVRAVAGGRDVDVRGFNRATHASRQVGSTFKPFVYAAALASGYAGNRMLTDDAVTIRTGRAMWTPTNFSSEFSGRMTMRTALVRSSNTATVRLAQDIGNRRIIAAARANGVESPLPDVPSLSLGSASLTPMELTAAYAPFANGGWRVVPHVVTRVERADGAVLWVRPDDVRAPAMTEEDAFLVTSMLQLAVDEGTARNVRQQGVRGPVAGKTGTTNDGADAWFVGYSPSLVTGVWLGADTPTSLGRGASGGRYAVPVWAQFMRSGWRSPERDRGWRAPSSLESHMIDANSGLLAAGWCGEAQREWFKAGTAPTESCQGRWFRTAGGFDRGSLEGLLLDGVSLDGIPPDGVSLDGISEEALEAAMEVIRDAIGEGELRELLLQRVADEVRRSTRDRSNGRDRPNGRQRR